MSAADYAETINADALTNNGSGNTPTPIFSEDQIENYENGWNGLAGCYLSNAPIQNHELSISGGTDNLKYLVSGGYLRPGGNTGKLRNTRYFTYAQT